MSGERLQVGEARKRTKEEGGGWVVPVVIQESEPVQCEQCRTSYRVEVEIELDSGQVEELMRNLQRALYGIYS